MFKENLGGIQTILRQYQDTKCFNKPWMARGKNAWHAHYYLQGNRDSYCAQLQEKRKSKQRKSQPFKSEKIGICCLFKGTITEINDQSKQPLITLLMLFRTLMSSKLVLHIMISPHISHILYAVTGNDNYRSYLTLVHYGLIHVLLECIHSLQSYYNNIGSKSKSQLWGNSRPTC